jgi:hypothetical protein
MAVAFPDIRTLGLLTNRVQTVFLEHASDFLELRSGRQTPSQPVGFLAPNPILGCWFHIFMVFGILYLVFGVYLEKSAFFTKHKILNPNTC